MFKPSTDSSMTTHSLLRSRLTPPGAVETNAAPDPINGRVEIALRGDGTAGYPLPGVFDQAVEELHELERIIASEWERRHPGEDLPRPAQALRMMLRGWVGVRIYPREN